MVLPGCLRAMVAALLIPGKAPQLKAPKMAERRTTIFPEVTSTGYRLAGAVERGRAEVTREKATGSNPKGLMFPSRTGMWLRSGSFHRDIFEPAARLASWEPTMTESANGFDQSAQLASDLAG